jgi:DNA mismatch endonuclease (patch repair protein)
MAKRPHTTAGRPRDSSRTRREAPVGGSWASTPGVRSRMQLQRTRDTHPEVAIRRILHAMGLRYRIDVPPLPGLRRRADIVFTRAKVAVYVDGCFWHGCPEHGRQPATNSDYWLPKLAGNRLRDADTDIRLKAAGWAVVRAWEHQDPADVAARICAAVKAALKSIDPPAGSE